MAEKQWKTASVEEVKELRGQVVGRITYDVYVEITVRSRSGECDIEPEGRGGGG